MSIRATKLVFGPEVFGLPAASSIARPGGTDNPNVAFVSQSKAELARETAAKSLAEIRRLPQDHPVQLQKLILIEKAFIAGESLLNSSAYGRAFAHFEALNHEIDDFGRSVRTKQEAQSAYDQILVRIRELDRARTLAPASLEAAFAAAGAGRQFLMEGSFDAAKSTFADGLVELDYAEQALTSYIEENLLRGQEALTKGDREGAAQAFNAALEKAPGTEIALQGLRRAETIDRVHALLQQGAALEAEGRFAQAAEAYEKAFSLDAFSAAAQQGQARAKRLDVETRFNEAYTAAQLAFERKDWPLAITEFEKALKVDPQKSEVQDLLKKARKNAHDAAVNKALVRAIAYEREYLWNEARQAYYETLQLEQDHPEAREGYSQTGKMIRLLLQYEKLVEIAEERAARAEFQLAIRSFNEAMAVKPAYLPMTDRLVQLRSLLEFQNHPVDVVFKSDGRTWVSISNFKLLGRFKTTRMQILPGDYEIIGRRKGYQDVMLLLQVRNGSMPPTVTVSCRLPARG